MAMSDHYDAVIIGGGHNGLTAAAYLAKNGLRVLVAERRPVLGGAAATETIFPDSGRMDLASSTARVNTGCWDAGLFLPEIVADLALEEHGLVFLESQAIVHSLLPGGRFLTLWRDAHRTAAELSASLTKSAFEDSLSPNSDGSRYLAFVQQVERLALALRPMLTLSPPPLKGYRPGEILPWLPAALGLKRLGNRDLMELLRVLPLPVWDWLDEWFESPALKAALGVIGTLGAMQGPKASGTAFLMLYHALGAGAAGFRASRSVRGGAGALSEALASAARRYGVEICTQLPVRQILLDGSRVVGVMVDDGAGGLARVAARAVLSSADPRTTFFGLVGASNLDVRLVREVKNIKFRGSLARVNLILNDIPQFPGIPSGERMRLEGHIQICPDLEYLERAYDDAKYGRFSSRPCLNLAIPTLLDSSLTAPGQHLLTINVQYAPYHLKDGDWDSQREQLGNRVVETLEEWIPGIQALILHRQVLTPLDLEREYGLPEGCIYHGQMGLDQLLFMRPVAGSRGSRTALENLYLCGAGAHPGGGLTGAPGYIAAHEVIQDLR